MQAYFFERVASPWILTNLSSFYLFTWNLRSLKRIFSWALHISISVCCVCVCVDGWMDVCVCMRVCVYIRFRSTGIRYYNQDGRRCTVGCEGLKRSEHYPPAFGTAYVDWWVSQRDTLRQCGHSGLAYTCSPGLIESPPHLLRAESNFQGWEFFIVQLLFLFEEGQWH